MPPKRTPPPPIETDGFSIEIDATVIEAALASVERRRRKPGEEEDPEPPPSEDLGLLPTSDADLHLRLLAYSERISAMEAEIRRVVEQRDQFDRQLREVRDAAREQSADFDRFRQRARKEKEDAERQGEERLLRHLLDTADNLDRAWQHAASDPNSLVGGLQIILDQFRGVLRRVGVERIGASRGAPFDPEVHEAVLHVSAMDVEPGAVVDEVSPGYRLRGRLFRPARVTVAAPP